MDRFFAKSQVGKVGMRIEVFCKIFFLIQGSWVSAFSEIFVAHFATLGFCQKVVHFGFSRDSLGF